MATPALPKQPPKLEPDQVIGDRFRLRRAVGEGGMGWVWEATTLQTNDRVALKFLKGGKDEDRRRFLRETRAAGAIEHPNVIAMKEVVELPATGMLLAVMDFLDGESLGSLLRREKKIALDLVCAIAVKVTHALEAAHAAGIVHRDLKPDNIFLTSDGDVKVLDFGVAKLTATEGLAARTQALTGTGAMVGTPYYMSPEQVVSEDDLDGRADIWSLGVVIYEALAGVRPTEAENVGRVLKRILVADFTPLRDQPADVLGLVHRMLTIDRNERPTLIETRNVLVTHAAKTLPSFGRSRSNRTTPTKNDDDDGALADTVLAARTARGDTNAAVSIARDAKPRRRLGAWLIVMGGAGLLAVGVWKLSPNASSSPLEAPATTTTALPQPTPISSPIPVQSESPPPTLVAVVVADPPPTTPATTAKPKLAPVVHHEPPAPAPPPTSSSSSTPASSSAPSAAPSSRLPPNLARSPKD